MMGFFQRRGRAVETAAGSPLPEDARRLRLRFVGQVQGVGFRWTTLKVAEDLGLTGWVRNERDGSVRAEIQGESSHVGAYFSRMLEEYRRYPISYTVEEREDIPLVPDETSFEVRY